MKVMADMKTATSPAWAERQALGARIVEIAALGDALSREKLACLRKFDELRGWADEGAVSCAHWLSLRTGLSRGAARDGPPHGEAPPRGGGRRHQGDRDGPSRNGRERRSR